MVDATTLLFGLPGLQVVNVTQQGDRTRIIDTVTDEDLAGCRRLPRMRRLLNLGQATDNDHTERHPLR